MLTSVRNTRIEWCHCDPAGIIFYPRYFDLFETSTIVLVERALGMSQSEYLKAYRFAGHPLVETRARFRQATRFGDEVAIETKLIECGRSSFKLEHRLTKAGALAVEASETRVWTINTADHPARLKPQPIPPEVLARFRGERVLPREVGR